MIKTILKALQDRLVLQIPELSGSVYRFHTYKFNDPVSINIVFGRMAHEEKTGVTNTTLEVIIELRVAVDSNQSLDEVLLDYHAKIFSAVTSDETLGLPFVFNATPVSTSEPRTSEDTESPSVQIELTLNYQFRHNRNDLTYQN